MNIHRTINLNTLALFPLVFFSFVFLALATPTHAWEQFADFSEYPLPITPPGATSMTLSASEPITLQHDYTGQHERNRDSIGEVYHLSVDEPHIDPAYPAEEAERGEFEEDGYIWKPVYADEVKDVYTHTEEVALTGEIELVSGSICVQEDRDAPVCLFQPGETHNIATQQPIRIIITGEEGSSYLPSFVVGDGRESHDLANESFKVYRTPGNTLYRMVWFDYTYTEAYIDHLFVEKDRLKRPIVAYESGGCPCETFEPDNPEHYLPENTPNICRLGGWADGYWPTMEIGRTIDRDQIIACPPEPSAEYIRAYKNFPIRGVAAYVRLAPKLAAHVTKFYLQRRKIGRTIAEFQAGEIGEDELLAMFSNTQHFLKEVYYLTPDI